MLPSRGLMIMHPSALALAFALVLGIAGSAASQAPDEAYRVVQNPDGTTTIVTDQPTTFVTITVKGRSKRVEDYFGAPESLVEFERQIDNAAGTRRWVFLQEGVAGRPASEPLSRRPPSDRLALVNHPALVVIKQAA